ncbi:MAG: NAD-dependent epimerase/dehydratase family protein [Janthinobacterium lividum]
MAALTRSRVAIIGAAGLIGQALARRLAADPRVATLILADRVPSPGPANSPNPADLAVEIRTGDFCDPAFARRLWRDADCVFHLAALLATETEANLQRGIAVNVTGLIQLLALGAETRSGRPPPRLVYTSSIAAFGGPLPETVDDTVARTPRTSYGTHKAIAELLIDDHTRRGLVDGRVLRLPIVLTRNGPASAAVSDRVAALIREPLLGRDVVCGLRPGTRMPVASAACVAAALWRLATLDAAALPPARAMNLPSLSVTAQELADAVARAPVIPQGRVTWSPDPALQAIVDGWPRRFASARATALGLEADASADAIVMRFLAENGLAREAPDRGSPA